MLFRGGVAGTAVLLYNCSNLLSEALDKKFKSRKILIRATHEIMWNEDNAKIYQLSGITTPEVVMKEKLDKHQPCQLDGTVEKEFRSYKAPLIVPENDIESNGSATDAIITQKGSVFDIALLQTGIVREQAARSLSDGTHTTAITDLV